MSLLQALQDIQTIVQQTAEAIAAALQIEVEIADSKMLRVAGTGRYREGCGQELEGVIYRHVLNTGRSVVIDEPGQHELCYPCNFRTQCSETAEVVVPILLSNERLGVIGLIGLTRCKQSGCCRNKNRCCSFWKKWLI